MDHRTRIAVVACAAALAAGTVRADLVGLRVFREGPGGGGTPPPGPERWIYRVYAEFTDPSDRVGFWGMGGLLSAGQIVNITTDGSPGSGFTNIPDNDSGNTAPIVPFTTRDWDTYMTIGILYGVQGPGGTDVAIVLPGTPTFISNGSNLWTGEQGSIILSDIFSPQGSGDYRIIGNDTANRVLLMQLVVNAGEHVEGTIGVGWDTKASGGITTGLAFTSVPGPGTVLVQAVFLIAYRRRARQEPNHELQVE